MNDKQISSQELLRKLRRAAQVRALVTMPSAFPLLFVEVAVLGPFVNQNVIAVLFFAGPLGISALITHFYCKQTVTCPHCGSSLWHCGTGNFKVRRMRIRHDAVGCSQCHAKLT